MTIARFAAKAFILITDLSRTLGGCHLRRRSPALSMRTQVAGFLFLLRPR